MGLFPPARIFAYRRLAKLARCKDQRVLNSPGTLQSTINEGFPGVPRFHGGMKESGCNISKMSSPCHIVPDPIVSCERVGEGCG